MDEIEFEQWEQERDIGQEILNGIKDIKAGKTGRRFTSKSYLVLTNLKKVLLEWDGKSRDDITAIYFDFCESPDFTNSIITPIQDADLQNGATWLLKKHLELGESLSTPQVEQIYTSLTKLNHWEAKLHVLQSICYLSITTKQKNSVESFLRTCLTDKNKFVRAWTYNGFYELARHHPEYKNEVDAMLAEALEKEAASVKARIRNILKQQKA